VAYFKALSNNVLETLRKIENPMIAGQQQIYHTACSTSYNLHSWNSMHLYYMVKQYVLNNGNQ